MDFIVSIYDLAVGISVVVFLVVGVDIGELIDSEVSISIGLELTLEKILAIGSSVTSSTVIAIFPLLLLPLSELVEAAGERKKQDTF